VPERGRLNNCTLETTGFHSVKVSAIESIGRIFYPKSSTLGDSVKEMRKSDDIPQLLITTIEKFYVFASSEPAVRHGSPIDSRISLIDAEFCLHTGVALISYLLALEDDID